MKVIISSLLILVISIVSTINTYGQEMETFVKAKVNMENKDIVDLATLGVAIDHGYSAKTGFVINDFSEREVQIMREGGFEVEVLIHDVSQWYVDRNKNFQALAESRAIDCDTGDEEPEYHTPRNYIYGSMGGYLTYTEALSEFDRMHQLYPDLISLKAPIGTIRTHEDRAIHWLRISNNPTIEEDEPEVLFTALHHAREPNSLSSVVFYMWYLLDNYATDDEVKYLVDNAQIYFIPIINPDGYVFNEMNSPNGGGLHRKNRNPLGAVDLNRNYDFHWGEDDLGSSPDPASQTYRGIGPFSEPETQAVRDFCNSHNFRMALNYHTRGNLLIYPWGYSDTPTDEHETYSTFARLMTKFNHFITGTGTETVGYTVNGVSDDWFYGEVDTKEAIYSMTPEVGFRDLGFWPPQAMIVPFNKSVLYQNLTTVHLILNYYTLEVRPEAINMYSSVDTLDLNVMKPGLLDGDATLSISISNPNFTPSFTTQEYSMGHLDQNTVELYVTANDQVFSGDTYDLTMTLDNGEYSQSQTITRTYIDGELMTLINEDFASLTDWADGTWGITEEDFYSSSTCFTDSPYGEPTPNNINTVERTDFISIPDNAIAPTLSFYTKWDIEKGFDYAQVLASTDGTNYAPLCGIYTVTGNENQDEDQPLYHGEQREWVYEEMDLSDYIGQDIKIAFRMVTDQAINKDGIYIDDMELSFLVPNTSGVSDLESQDMLTSWPNPISNLLTIKLSNQLNLTKTKVEIYNALGELMDNVSRPNSQFNFVTKEWSNGVYFIHLLEDGKSIGQYKVVK